MVTYFNYDPSTDSYSVASPGQWLSLDDKEYGGAYIDGKRFAKLMEKRQAQGMKDVPEQTQGYSMGMMGY